MQCRHLGHRSVAFGTLGLVFTLALLALACQQKSVDAQTGGAPPPVATSSPTPTPATKPPAEPPLFSSWPKDKKPDVVLVLSGQQYSYLKFCGCSPIQLGGFERRYNFIATLKEKGWPVIALDLGDLISNKHSAHDTPVKYVHEQQLLKYVAAMKSLNVLNYTAIGVGENDFNMPLIEGLTKFPDQKLPSNPRLLATNMKDRMAKFPLNDTESMIGDFVTAGGENGVPVVGAFALVGPGVRKSIQDPTIAFENPQKVEADIRQVIANKKVALPVLLYQDQPIGAAQVAEILPEFRVILSCTPEEEPPMFPRTVGKSMIVNVGQRGRYVGVVGAFRTADGKDFDLHYQLVKMDPEWETPKDKEKTHPVLQVVQDYAERVKEANLFSQFPKTPYPFPASIPAAAHVRGTYIGSQKCAQCHQKEFDIWSKSGHSHAYDTLVNKAVKPTLRQFDGECVVCHVVGFEYNSGFENAEKSKHLLNVGCENCHGPGNLHASDQNNPVYRASLSPWKTKPTDKLYTPDGKYDNNVLLRIDKVCQKCHDTDNDPIFKFEDYWPKIVHTRGKAPVQGKPPAKPAVPR